MAIPAGASDGQGDLPKSFQPYSEMQIFKDTLNKKNPLIMFPKAGLM